MDNKKRIEEYIESHKEEMIKDLIGLINIKSFREEEKPGMPYGEGPYNALMAWKKLLEEEGFATKVYDNKILSGDLTNIKRGLDILVHTDTVPAEENKWTVCNPFCGTLVEDRVYGRGSIDDKGPGIAAFYAMKCVRDLGIKLKKNVRLVIGSDEECGSGDLPCYIKAEGEAEMTFTPDADFPVINTEKGRVQGCIKRRFCTNDKESIKYIKAGSALNVIPEISEARISNIDKKTVLSVANRLFSESEGKKSSVTVSLDELENRDIKIVLTGKGGHGAFPENCENSLTAMLLLLSRLPYDIETDNVRTIKALSRMFPHGDYLGKALGIDKYDEISKYTTCSLDVISVGKEELKASFDTRLSIVSTKEETVNVLKNTFEGNGFDIDKMDYVLPHHVDENSEFVQTLLSVYEEFTGTKGYALSTGGGTYVHDLERGVAFGCEMEGIDNNMHGNDEFITLNQLLLSAKIFAQAIIKLCA